MERERKREGKCRAAVETLGFYLFHSLVSSLKRDYQFSTKKKKKERFSMKEKKMEKKNKIILIGEE